MLMKPPEDPAAFLRAVQRKDFAWFLRGVFFILSGGDSLAWNWHLDAIAYQLGRVRAGKSQRLLVTMPPRNLKSIAISVAWVAWMLGHNPRLKFVCVSYSDELALKLARDCRMVMQSSWYRELFPRTIIAASRTAVHDFETTAGGNRLATSIKGTVTGRGGNYLIIDDPIKPDEAMSETTRTGVNESFSRTLATRLDDKENGSIVVVMQRLHEEDLAGALIEKGHWDHLSLPAIAPEDAVIRLTRGRVHRRKVGDVLHPARESRHTLGQLRVSLGSAVFSAQYQQQPVPAAGNMAKADWLRRYDCSSLPHGGRVVQSWDTASKDGIHNDWSVCVTAHVYRREIRILDVWRARVDFVGLKREVMRLAREWKPQALLIEDAASGMQLLQTLRNEQPSGVPMPIARKPEGDKATRFSAICPMIEAGQLLLPTEAPWLADFKSEILGFPNARHDDQADALAQLMIWVGRQQRFESPPAGGYIIDVGTMTEEDWFNQDAWADEDDACLY